MPKLNSLKSLAVFNGKIERIAIAYNAEISRTDEKGRPLAFMFKTDLGELKVSLDYDKSRIYCVFMQFGDDFLIEKFKAIFPNEGSALNPYSYKWNILSCDEAYARSLFLSRMEKIFGRELGWRLNKNQKPTP